MATIAVAGATGNIASRIVTALAAKGEQQARSEKETWPIRDDLPAPSRRS